MRRYLGALSVVLALTISVLPSALSAQGPFDARRPARPAPTGWAPIELGIHVGYEYSSRGTVLGGQMRIPLLKSGYLELVPNGDVTWGRGTETYTGGADLVALSGGRRGGLFAGGGLAWRNSQQVSGVRTTELAPTIVVGARSPALFGAPFGTQVDIRWILIDSSVKPRSFSFGINLPLWGWGEEKGGRRGP